MQIRFAESDENFIKSEVKNGFYTTENEVVRDAVRRLREDKERQAHLRAAIALGDADIAAGRTTSFNEALVEKMKQNAIARANSGETVDNPDVTP